MRNDFNRVYTKSDGQRIQGIAGLRGVKARTFGEMVVVAAGMSTQVDVLPCTLDQFFEYTGLERSAWNAGDRADFGSVEADLLLTMDKNRIVERGFYAFIPFVFYGPEKHRVTAEIRL